MNKRGKKANSHFYFDINKIVPKSKRSQQVFGMGFGMIFSIILIIFILVVAGIAINKFLETKKCAQIGMFKQDLQEDVDTAWNSQRFTDSGNLPYILPSGLNYVCFANLSDPLKGGNLESKIYTDISFYELYNGNVFFYPTTKACDMPYLNIKHININEITSSRNPYCLKIEDGKVRIKIEKAFNEALVRLS